MRDYVDQTWGWDQEWQRLHFDQHFDPSALRIIEKGGKPIGYISIQRSSDEIYLAAIEIAPEHQNQGVATQLIGDLLRDSDSSRTPVRLRVLKVNPARRLYERLGFRCSGENATHFMMAREPVSDE